jgi:hypothetical protein
VTTWGGRGVPPSSLIIVGGARLDSGLHTLAPVGKLSPQRRQSFRICGLPTSLSRTRRWLRDCWRSSPPSPLDPCNKPRRKLRSSGSDGLCDRAINLWIRDQSLQQSLACGQVPSSRTEDRAMATFAAYRTHCHARDRARRSKSVIRFDAYRECFPNARLTRSETSVLEVTLHTDGGTLVLRS